MTPLLREQLVQRAAQVGAGPIDAAGVPSPCVSVCKMDSATGLCQGCLRTLDEIAAWSRMGDEGKRVVWQQLARRVALMEVDG